MRTAAQLDRVPARFEHADDVAVLVSEERDGSELLRVGLRRLVVVHRVVRKDLVVGEVLDLADLLVGERLIVAEIEAQAIRCYERALLLHVVAEDLAQRPVQDVRAGVIAPDRVAAGDVDGRHRLLAGRDLAFDDAGDVPVQTG